MVRIVSDLHIESPDDAIYRALIRLIDRLDPSDTLVLAGDVFDFMVGRPFFWRRYSEFFESLRRASGRGAVLHYIEGNHDVNLAKLLAAVPGLTHHTTEVALPVGTQRLYVAHGDLANSHDRPYRLWRWIVRTTPARAVFGLLPESLVLRLGQKLSSLSRDQRCHRVQTDQGFARIRPIYRSFAAEKAASGFDFVVLGHCHDLDEMGFSINGKTARYMNVGYPKIHGSYVCCHPEKGLWREALPAD